MTGRKGKIWESQSREIVLAVDKYFEQEKSRSSNLLKVMTQLAKDSNDSETITLSRDLFDEVVNMLKNTNRVTERVVAATGISKNTVSRIRGEGAFAAATSSKICSPKRGKRGPNPEIDKFDINAIKNLIEHMYEVQKCNPTVGKIFIKAKEDLNFPGGETTLRKLMKEKLGYKFKKCPQKKMELVEKEPNVSDWGVIYLPIPMED